MKKKFFFLLLFGLLGFTFSGFATDGKKAIVYVEGNFDMQSPATAEGRQLAALLGHFSLQSPVKGINAFNENEAKQYSTVFYIGYTNDFKVPANFKNFVLTSNTKVVWINQGIGQLETSSKFGFKQLRYVADSKYGMVKSGNKVFTKGNGKLNMLQLVDKNKVKVIASAYGKGVSETPYIISSGNLTYIGDSPFEEANETDRYLLFADMLHDILGIQHAEEHRAMVRIEDITVMSNPDKLRDIADILSERNIPFLVGVVPFYVNPNESKKISLSENPELVDALKYMVANGGTIVMHGVTHQYKGVSTDDFEFWDGAQNSIIPEQTQEDIATKVESGIQEFMKNGLYPVLWETPHYTASLLTYSTVAKYFSTSIEQRLAIEKFDYGQYFPFLIQNDLYGQKVYPENLGYVPLNANEQVSWDAAKHIIRSADYVKNVRDGYASFFFHPFINLNILKEVADSIQAKGFTFYNIKDDKNWVKLHDRVILTGSQQYTITLASSYLVELYYNEKGELAKKVVSKDRIVGNVTKKIELQPGWSYVAEPSEYQYEQPSFTDRMKSYFDDFVYKHFKNKDWQVLKPTVLWNPSARGAAFHDQSSLISIFKSLNINADTLFLGEKLDLSQHNLLVVPYALIDSLNDNEIAQIVNYVKEGGNLICDHRSRLAEKLGFQFTNDPVQVIHIRDKAFPQEDITWNAKELTFKFSISKDDKVYCEDPASGIPMVIGREVGKGKVLFINSFFDPLTEHGYSRYPFIMEHVRKFMAVRPMARRENLEMFFDPGLRPASASVESLVKNWVKSGVRIIHVAGWHEYPTYTYDYARLIKLCHANGILVYAWVEPPQVSQKFWNDHPEWREKNYLGKDVRPAWRYPVALTDPQCVNAILSNYKQFFGKFDFDGVNLGELYFESGRGFIDPAVFTPMHPSALKEIEQKYHFNARDLFNPSSALYWKHNNKARAEMVEYRINKMKELHETFLKFFSSITSAKPGFQVIVTTMDTYGSPELKEEQGEDVDKILDLQKKYQFVLNVEDPANRWSTDPSRYIEIGKFYAAKVGNPKLLMLDLNILKFRDRHDVTPFPTLIQTGIESYELIKSAAVGSPRFVVYAEGSVNQQDMNMFAYASAADVKYSEVTAEGFNVSSPYSFTLTLPENIKAIYVDDIPVVGYRENCFLIPSGNHAIKYANEEMLGFSSALIQPQILSFTGNILAYQYGMKSLSLTYESDYRTILSINRKPESVKVDGQDYKFEVMNGNDCFSIFVPSGKHQVEVQTGSDVSYSVDITSLWSSSAIVLFGAIAVTLLIVMFVFMKIYRRYNE
jgi:uncharacterized protein YdaL